MKGSKPLTDTEIELVLSHLKSMRDKALFIVGVRTGFRISELLSLKYSDIIEYGDVKEEITVTRANMKGAKESRAVVLHPQALEILRELLKGSYDTLAYLFPISRMQAHRILKSAFRKAGIKGKVSTHSMRKSFAKRVYEALDRDLVNTQKALGHKSISSTISYLSFDQEAINKAIKSA